MLLIRRDIHFSILAEHNKNLASSVILSRFKNNMINRNIGNVFFRMIEIFIYRIENQLEKIVLDSDPTDCVLYGRQEIRFYHGDYKDY